MKVLGENVGMPVASLLPAGYGPRERLRFTDAGVFVYGGGMTLGEAIEKARRLEELTGCSVALEVDSIRSAAQLYDMLSDRGRRA